MAIDNEREVKMYMRLLKNRRNERVKNTLRRAKVCKANSIKIKVLVFLVVFVISIFLIF